MHNAMLRVVCKVYRGMVIAFIRHGLIYCVTIIMGPLKIIIIYTPPKCVATLTWVGVQALLRV